MVKVLVSLKDATEARNAAALGLDLVDFKDPSQGPMGGLNPSDLQTAVNCLGDNQKVSAACGELLDLIKSPRNFCPGVDYYKVGLSGTDLGDTTHWLELLTRMANALANQGLPSRLVPVFYADRDKASSPNLREGIQLVLENGFGMVLIDTWDKNASNLLDVLSMGELLKLQDLVRDCQGQLALAGSLTLECCTSLLREGIRPDWFGFRGAVCIGGRRGGIFDPQKAMDLMAGLKGWPG